MKSGDFVDLLIQLGIMLAVGASLGWVLRKLKQPSVVGEMGAGVLIGVTVLGSVAPGVHEWIFESSDSVATGRDAIIKIGTMLFLYVAGSEVDLSDIKTLGKRSLTIGLVGTVLPIMAGSALVYATPVSLWGETVGIERLPFSLFIGMNLANSANPVLARILLDLGMMKSRIATVMMTATIIDDLLNWTLYAIILGTITTAGADTGSDRGLAVDLLLVALLFVFVLGVLRWAVPHIVGFVRKHSPWPNGYIATAGVALIGVAALSEAIGVQAFLGAFLVGVAFSSTAAGQGAQGHKALSSVAIGFFAPLFFVNMALGTDFVESFDIWLVLLVIGVALGSKLVAVVLGVKAAGLPIGREAWAIAWGLNARGATGIILAATGLQAGIISEKVFVALVVMAIVTSLLAGPMMVRSLGPLRESMTGAVDDEVLEDVAQAGVSPDYAARLADRDLTEAERAALGDDVLFRVLVAIDDPTTAEPLVRVAADLAASQQPAEVVLASFEEQGAVPVHGAFSALEAIASELDSLRGLEAIVQARGLTVQSTSQRSTDLAADIAAHAQQVGAHTLVVGDRRDDPQWVATVDGLIASSPIDMYVVVAPLPRAGQVERSGAPVVEAGEGLPGQAALEAGVRFALSGEGGPTVVGVAEGSKAAQPYAAVLERLGRLGHPGRIAPAALDSAEGVGLAAEARFVVRPFSAPEGLEPIERARPDAERLGCPLVLVAPDPRRAQRHSLTALLDEAEASAVPTD